MAGSSSLAKLIFLVIMGLAFPGASHGGPAGRATFAARPSGEWSVSGRVVTAHHVQGREVGEVLKRRWRFEAACGDADCPTLFLRTSADGSIERTPLHFGRRDYTAAFGPISTGCEERPGWFASFDGRFRIWWSKDRSRLLAEERGFFPGGHGCPPAVEKIMWTATRHFGNPSEGADEVL